MLKKGYLILAVVIALLSISSSAFAADVDKKFETIVKEYKDLKTERQIPSEIPYDNGKGYAGNLKAKPGPVCTNYGTKTSPSITCFVTYEGWIYYSY
ncbi:hypothetical protein ACEU2D_24765 [Brevibacillus laterosporus]|uniref:hypothetical protein n=1 Tax=Brevibacillus laterosporus TaxID=1465 RepID=UPI0035A6E9A2